MQDNVQENRPYVCSGSLGPSLIKKKLKYRNMCVEVWAYYSVINNGTLYIYFSKILSTFKILKCKLTSLQYFTYGEAMYRC